mmetsp:Transcript_4142/g.7341  ORF Transcript_4142/g.7341 Transcript_4142/m.7341 type:complete len:581 (+) Transcript_4142:47-1789(+)|eukprot:CAMPEP_0201641632 /NCGR_PEP_ID=MMETSP0493-20130528/24555_1 /ASSEMBLY_ACC=CAM_ASM_000838 /TAXON_ID=420259 /ORGANISM="Thalassiosira gravida, Strain GMp14c1" /LENGTH=580 /DNA_ID=CAMNT_0048115593 /DNA_START=45 /DNA_END=1787 /DNA_ORIENTATION=+
MAENGTQDDGRPPLISARSIMVGERRDSYNNSGNRVVFAESVDDSDSQHSDDAEFSLTQSPLNISQYSLTQSRLAARRGRSRSDEEALAQSVADAGLNAFGCIFVELWVMTEDGTKLTRPSGGHWMKPAFAQSLKTEELIDMAWMLDRSAGNCAPGAGLAGTLAEESGMGSQRVHWRQIKSLLNDPFVQRGEGKRMEKIFELGIGLVASVPFSFQDGKGIVVYYSRSTADVEMLRHSANERYLVGSTDLVGANYSIQKAREQASEVRKELIREARRKLRKEFIKEQQSFASLILNPNTMEKLKKASMMCPQDAEMAGLGASVPRVDHYAVTLAKTVCKHSRKVPIRLTTSLKKWKGAKLHGPPRQSFGDCFFCFIGVFLTMLALLKVEKSVRVDSNFNLDVGWYPSTLCIVFALTPAPVGQPRQIYLAHIFNILVGLACRQIPTGGFGDFEEWDGATNPHGLPMIWVQALAVGLGVSGQAFLGIMHPPATGMALTFASNPLWSWGTMAAVLLVDCIVVVLSMMIINLSEKKQYPLFWLGLGWEGSGGTLGMVRYVARSARRSVSNTARSITGKNKGDDFV